MLGESELDKFRSISDQYTNFKTLLSGAKNPNFSAFASTPDMNSDDSGLAGLLNMDTSGLDADSLINNIVNGFASGFAGMGSKVGLNINNSNIKGDDSGGGILSKLIKLILGIVELPMRFGYLFSSLMQGTGALALGVGGISQSVALGTKDVYILIIAILKIIFKYFLCILSFIITTIGGCFLIHVITLFFVMLYLFIMFLLDMVNEATGFDLSPMVDKALEVVKWPEPIGMICYSCFGKRVKLREVLADVGVLEDIGNMISYDFNNTMPRYMKPAVPLGSGALKMLDKAMN
jgi:hypothetical protein